MYRASSSNAQPSMANMTYATSSPAATTGGQGNNPVSYWNDLIIGGRWFLSSYAGFVAFSFLLWGEIFGVHGDP